MPCSSYFDGSLVPLLIYNLCACIKNSLFFNFSNNCPLLSYEKDNFQLAAVVPGSHQSYITSRQPLDLVRKCIHWLWLALWLPTIQWLMDNDFIHQLIYTRSHNYMSLQACKLNLHIALCICMHSWSGLIETQ